MNIIIFKADKILAYIYNGLLIYTPTYGYIYIKLADLYVTRSSTNEV